MKHLLILLSILLLSSFLTSCEEKNGPGTETYEDGSSYVGVFKDGEERRRKERRMSICFIVFWLVLEGGVMVFYSFHSHIFL